MTAELDWEQRHHLGKIATPAHVAQYCTRNLPPDAQWKPAKHLLHLNRIAVDAVTDDRQRFLQIAVSVRAGKSVLLSVWLIVWYLGMFPDRQVILVSYSEDKAGEWGERVRDILTEFGAELFGIMVDGGTNASRSDWKIKGRLGGMRSVGTNGALTGGGGALIVVDDPVKNDEEADSPAAQKKMRKWYDGTLRSRLTPTGTMILTMARWSERDLAGSILEDVDEGMDQWEVVNLPAVATPTKADTDAPDYDPETWTDAIGRKMGDPLWPEGGWTTEVLARIKATVSKRNPQIWDAQYQQDPTSLEGTAFKKENWRYVPSVDRTRLRMCRFWDLAASERSGDYTVGMLVGMDNDDLIYVLDVVRIREEAAGVERQVKQTAIRDGKGIPVRIEQERAGAGKSVTSTYVRLLVGWDVAGVRAEGKKEDRAAGLAAQHQNGRVIIVGTAVDPMFAALIEEARVWPGGRNDDQIDSLVGAFSYLVEGGPTTLVAEELLDVPMGRMLLAGMRGLPG